jgi:SHAQKYF class myb-like DNA-binding protein
MQKLSSPAPSSLPSIFSQSSRSSASSTPPQVRTSAHFVTSPFNSAFPSASLHPLLTRVQYSGGRGPSLPPPLPLPLHQLSEGEENDEGSGSESSPVTLRLSLTPSSSSPSSSSPSPSMKTQGISPGRREGRRSEGNLGNLLLRRGSLGGNEGRMSTESEGKGGKTRRRSIADCSHQGEREGIQEEERSGNGNGSVVGKWKGRDRLKWTKSLHRAFVHAIEALTWENATPSTILYLMKEKAGSSVCVTRSQVASHLQVKYLLSLPSSSSSSRGSH